MSDIIIEINNVGGTSIAPKPITVSELKSTTEIDSGATTRPKFVNVYDSTGLKISGLTIGPEQVTQPGGSGTNWIIKFPQMGGTQNNVTLYIIAS